MRDVRVAMILLQVRVISVRNVAFRCKLEGFEETVYPPLSELGVQWKRDLTEVVKLQNVV